MKCKTNKVRDAIALALIVGVGYWVIGGSPRKPRATAAAERTPARPVASVAPEPAPVD